MLVCPWCLGALEEASGVLRCVACRAAYPVEQGTPRMMIEDAKLVCPFCNVVMEKRPPRARCPACSRRFRMDEHVRGRLSDHVEK